MRRLLSIIVAAASVFSLIFSSFSVAQEGSYVNAYTAQDRAVNIATLCLLMGRPKEQCIPEKLNDEGIEAVNEQVDNILGAVTTLQNSNLPIDKEKIDAVVGAANTVGNLIKECAGTPDNPQNCVEEVAEDASRKLKEATDAAREACDKLPENKEVCKAAVNEFEDTTNKSIAKILAIAGPVLAACAVTVGAGCAIAALLAIAQLFGDSGSGDDGSKGSKEGSIEGDDENGSAKENDERLREQFPETGDLKVNTEGGAIRISGEANGRKVNFRLGGYFEKPNYKKGGDDDVTAEKIAEAINSAGSLANYLSGTKQKVQHTFFQSKDGVAFCENLEEGIVTAESADSKFAIVIVIPARGSSASVHTRADAGCS